MTLRLLSAPNSQTCMDGWNLVKALETICNKVLLTRLISSLTLPPRPLQEGLMTLRLLSAPDAKTYVDGWNLVKALKTIHKKAPLLTRLISPLTLSPRPLQEGLMTLRLLSAPDAETRVDGWNSLVKALKTICKKAKIGKDLEYSVGKIKVRGEVDVAY